MSQGSHSTSRLQEHHTAARTTRGTKASTRLGVCRIRTIVQGSDVVPTHSSLVSPSVVSGGSLGQTYSSGVRTHRPTRSTHLAIESGISVTPRKMCRLSGIRLLVSCHVIPDRFGVFISPVLHTTETGSGRVSYSLRHPAMLFGPWS